MLLICDSECILSARLVFFSQCFRHYFFQHSLRQSPLLLYFHLEYCSFSSQRSQEGTYIILRCWHRGTESEEQIQKRLRNAKAELERAKDPTLFDHILVNAKLDEAYENLKALLGVDSISPHAKANGNFEHRKTPTLQFCHQQSPLLLVSRLFSICWAPMTLLALKSFFLGCRW
jgi:23S rRNA maturation mini-RNase III